MLEWQHDFGQCGSLKRSWYNLVMSEKSAGQQIDEIIKLHKGWKGETVSQLRAVILASDSRIFEEVKWKMPSRPEGLAVWSYNGIVCLVEIFKNDLKLVFFKGAMMPDAHKQFNARLKSRFTRAIEYHEGYTVNAAEIKSLVHEAVALNDK